jgi:hypothetical protein
MRSCLFIGPSAVDAPVHQPGLSLFGPARLGSVFRAVEEGYECIAIADGYFGNVAPVWHKEILWAMSRGVVVMGGVSMGALRAAELDLYGMVGIGCAYRLFKSGYLTDDDEVCVIHAPKEFGYRPLSLPMVNFRFTLRRMKRRRLISPASEIALVSDLKRLHFSQRTAQNFTNIAVGRFGRQRGEILGSCLSSEYIDIKHKDCEMLIPRLSQFYAVAISARLVPGWGACVEDEGLVDSLFWCPGRACEGAGELVFAVLAGAGLVDPDGPVVGGALVAQAQDRGGLAVPGQQRGDVAVLAAVADEGLAEAGPAGPDVGGDPGGDGVAGLLVGCVRHAVHDGRRGWRRPRVMK